MNRERKPSADAFVLPQLLSEKGVAAYLGASRQFVRELRIARKLKAYRLSRNVIRYRIEDVHAYLDNVVEVKAA